MKIRLGQRHLMSLTFGLVAMLLVTVAPQATSRRAYAEATSVPMLFGSAPDAPDGQLQEIVESTIADLGGTWGVAVKKLDTGQYAQFNGDKQQVSASLFKTWVLNELFHQVQAGTIALDDATYVSADDAGYDASHGDLRMNVGDSVTLRQAAYSMVTVSDNTAAHILVRTLGPDNINSYMQSIGLRGSLLDWSGVGDNLTTPIDMLHEFEMIATSHMVDAASSQQMVSMLLDQQINNLLPGDLPDGVKFAHKTGALDSLLHDAGIVYGPTGPFVIVVMASNLDSNATAWDNMPLLSRRVYDYFNSRPTSANLYFAQTKQTVGHDFLKVWQEFGGKDIFGYPLGPEEVRNGVLVQPFERGRFELHRENATGSGPTADVSLANVGSERAAQLNLTWPRSADTGSADSKYFADTGQSLSGGFLNFWLNNGGERLFGKPISPEEEMTNPTDGKTYTSQYFERARMEYHPDMPAGHRVVLGALVRELTGSR
ncbi:MAG: serine hydrolase [Chloroflexota bacterium]|nr:serine hydrolase [Chloroflexota bacterium]